MAYRSHKAIDGLMKKNIIKGDKILTKLHMLTISGMMQSQEMNLSINYFVTISGIEQIPGGKNVIDQIGTFINRAKNYIQAPRAIITANTKEKAIGVRNHEIYYLGKYIYIGHPKSLSTLILIALITRANQEGVCLYEEINKFLVANGKPDIRNLKKMRKRINDAVNYLVRRKTKRIDNIPNIKDLIKCIDEVGYKLTNLEI